MQPKTELVKKPPSTKLLDIAKSVWKLNRIILQHVFFLDKISFTTIFNFTISHIDHSKCLSKVMDRGLALMTLRHQSNEEL